MCYMRRDRSLEREARRVTESRLMEEEARHRHEEHRRRREREEKPPSEKVEKVKELKEMVVGTDRYRQVRQ